MPTILCNKKTAKRYVSILNLKKNYSGSGYEASREGESMRDFQSLNAKEGDQESGEETSGEGDYVSVTIV